MFYLIESIICQNYKANEFKTIKTNFKVKLRRLGQDLTCENEGKEDLTGFERTGQIKTRLNMTRQYKEIRQIWTDLIGLINIGQNQTNLDRIR